MNSAYEWVNKRTRPAKPNNKTMKYRVTTDILESIDKGDLLKKSRYKSDIFIHRPTKNKFTLDSLLRNPDWFEPVEEVQEGQYWEDDTGNIVRVNRINEKSDHKRAILGDIQTDNECDLNWSVESLINNARKLSTDEIKEALIKEAKRRGFEKNKKVKRFWESTGHIAREATLNHVPAQKSSIGTYFSYLPERDSLCCCGVEIYYKGQWAQIVDQTPDIEINGHEVELYDDCVKVGCEVLSPQFIKELNVILQKHGAEFIVSGNDISSQIRQIAKHYGNMAGEPVEFNDTFNVSGMGFSATNMWKAND